MPPLKYIKIKPTVLAALKELRGDSHRYPKPFLAALKRHKLRVIDWKRQIARDYGRDYAKINPKFREEYWKNYYKGKSAAILRRLRHERWAAGAKPQSRFRDEYLLWEAARKSEK